MVKVAVLGIGGHAGHVMRPAADGLVSEGYDVVMVCADAVVLDDDPERLADFIRTVRRSDILFIDVHGDVSYFKHFRNLKDAVERSGISALLYGCEESVVLGYRDMFDGDDEDYGMLRLLETLGGDENHRSALLWCLRRYDGIDTEIPAPVVPMAQGVYIPGRGAVPLSEGLKDVGSTGRPVVLVLFVSAFNTRGNTDAMDGLCRAVEARGGEPLAVFTRSYEDPAIGAIGLGRLIDEHLLRDGRPIVDAVLNTMGFALTVLSQPGCGEQVSTDNFLQRLGVPVIQAINLMGSMKRWKESPFGLTPSEIAYCVVSPEFDGQIDATAYCGTEQMEGGEFRQVPIEDRCDALAEMALRWGALRRIPEREKKVAVLIYMYPPRQDLAGGGYGLDTFESVVSLLRVLKDRGYSIDWIPENGKELAERLLEGVTNDDNWASDAALRERAASLISKEKYGGWFGGIPPSMQERMVSGWGDPPGDIHMVDGRQLVGGFVDGNVYIGFQPDRGKCTTEAYHDPWTAAPHQYLGVYRWISREWGADAIVHVGTHGTLEWLPGKSVALSGECDPDVILDRIPDINPYIIDNPGEGMQSKRRQYAVTTTHMIPAMGRAGGYDELSALETAVQAFLKTREIGDEEKMASSVEAILEMCRSMNMLSDLDLETGCSAEEMDEAMDRLYDYILEVKDAMIKDGLHILGEVPEDERMCETVYSLVRYPNGNIPSLRESVAHAYGCEMEDLLKDPSGTGTGGRLNGELIDAIDADAYRIIEAGCACGFDEGRTRSAASEIVDGLGDDAFEAIGFMCGFVAPAVRRMPDELGNIARALDGEYIEPGPSGCPGRGRAQILPTGRNFYSIDPDGIPWASSWEIGSKMAEDMVSRYLEDHGRYPDSVGMVLWATDTMKTGGDDIAYILKLMGLRPVWTGYGGRVCNLEVISLEELGRPRIDVTLRISGLFRDTFPNLSNMIDSGVQTIASLDEDDESNRLAANVRRDMVEAIAAGMPADEARRNATIRIFGDPPGSYGNGISDAVQTGRWETVEDLGEIFVKHGCFVYGRGLQGESRPELFRRRLSRIDATIKNHNTRAVDMLDMDDDFDSLGGFTAAVTAIRGEMPESYMGDSSDMQNLKLRTTAEECRFIFRSKIDNPKWLNGLKKHGFAGAKELSKLFDYTMGWSATNDIVENWMYDDLANRFVLDEETSEWIKDENPYAMMAMLARLYEAEKRGFWSPSPEMKDQLKQTYMDFEGRIEEITDRRSSSGRCPADHHDVEPSYPFVMLDHGIYVEDLLHDVGRQDLRDGSGTDDLTFLHEDDVVAVPRSVGQVVRHHDDDHVPGVAEMGYEIHQRELVIHVQMKGGFVEKEDLRILGQGAGYHHASQLSAAQLLHGPLGELQGASLLHGVVYLLVLLLLRGGGSGVQSHPHCVVSRVRERHGGGLGYDSVAAGQLLAVEFGDVDPVLVRILRVEDARVGFFQEHRASLRLQHPVDAFQKSRLSASVLSEDS